MNIAHVQLEKGESCIIFCSEEIDFSHRSSESFLLCTVLDANVTFFRAGFQVKLGLTDIPKTTKFIFDDI